MYDPTKVKIDSGHVRKETAKERICRLSEQLPAMMVREKTGREQFLDYERARTAGKVEYYELGRRSRRA
jgi:hypothetical protein